MASVVVGSNIPFKGDIALEIENKPDDKVYLIGYPDNNGWHKTGGEYEQFRIEIDEHRLMEWLEVYRGRKRVIEIGKQYPNIPK